MQLSPLIPPLVGVIFTILIPGLLLRRFGQPQLVGHILAGVVSARSGSGCGAACSGPRPAHFRSRLMREFGLSGTAL